MAEEPAPSKKIGKQNNTLRISGNEGSMNLNALILTNIQSSSYFKVHLFKLKTYHEVVDEIYYNVKHLEPWERASRNTSGQVGMCGGVRGVGAGGIVSSAYCLLFKLHTLRLTRKQLNGLINHTDSPYIRALGFMYIRYTQQAADLFDWYEEYLQDEEEIDVKAGGGQTITIGQMLYRFLTKLDWFSTLFPRIPVNVQKQIEKRIEQYCRENQISVYQLSAAPPAVAPRAAVTTDYDAGYEQREDSSNRDAYHKALPPAVNYRGEHDNRGDHVEHRRRNDSPQQDGSSRERHREKHKKKRKHKHRTRSRSTSRGHKHSRGRKHSRSRSRSRSRSYDRSRKYERDQVRSRSQGRDRY